MYFSFSALPGVKELNLKDRQLLYRDVIKSLSLGSKYCWLLLLSFAVGFGVLAIMVAYGLKGDVLGYSALASMFLVWIVGYIYILNKQIYPEVKRMRDELKES